MDDNTANFQNSFTLKLGLNSLAKIVTGKLSSADKETLSIVFNTEQFQMLMQSLEEARCGKILTIKEAFSDLN
jgi:hypothetical protein